ncbi:MAG: CHAP domain-containing protein [Candidatus Ancillula sp.]|jgi:hypothetical protein|nr:CHAP domain-containing protein [Candidatus Ancillula sp.]
MQDITTWANARQGITFEDFSNSDLSGQCVALVKCFLAECCDGINSPYGARGDAIDFGNTLVAQEYADQTTGELVPGDILVYDEGTQYGHIALYIGNEQLFEENAAYPPASLASNGTWTSRIGAYRNATWAYRMRHQYYNNNEQEGQDNMRHVYNKGDGALHWFTDTHYGGYHDYDELQADLNTGVAKMPVIDWTDPNYPLWVRCEATRIFVN